MNGKIVDSESVADPEEGLNQCQKSAERFQIYQNCSLRFGLGEPQETGRRTSGHPFPSGESN